MDVLDRIFCSTWTTVRSWQPDDAVRSLFPPRHSDYRDTAPRRIETVHQVYDPNIREGRWTVGESITKDAFSWTKTVHASGMHI
jgi:hypothetical protein